MTDTKEYVRFRITKSRRTATEGILEVVFEVRDAATYDRVHQRLHEDPFYLHGDLKEAALDVVRERHEKEVQQLKLELAEARSALKFAINELQAARGLPKP